MRWLLLPCLALAVGCTHSNPDTVVLRISNWSGAGDDSEFEQTVRGIYQEFEKRHPGVDVRVEGIPDGYVSKVILSFVAGTEPDVMLLDASSAAMFIDNGVLADLTPMIKADSSFALNEFFSNVVDIARRGESPGRPRTCRWRRRRA